MTPRQTWIWTTDSVSFRVGSSDPGPARLLKCPAADPRVDSRSAVSSRQLHSVQSTARSRVQVVAHDDPRPGEGSHFYRERAGGTHRAIRTGMTHRNTSCSSLLNLCKWTAIALATTSLMGCAGTRYGLEAPSSSPSEIDAAAMELRVIDTRGAPAADRIELSPPAHLEVRATRRVPVGLTTGYKLAVAQRLRDIVDGDGSTLEVLVEVERAEVEWSATPEGPVAKVRVAVDLTVYDADGGVLQRGKSHAEGRVEAEDATPSELTEAVEATALNAFDRYFAREKMVTALNRALANRG